MPGEEVWWYHNKQTNDIYFNDSLNEPSHRSEEPHLIEFDDHNISMVVTSQSENWKQCIDLKIQLPIPTINLYNDNGDFVAKNKCLNIICEEEECEEDIVTHLILEPNNVFNDAMVQAEQKEQAPDVVNDVTVQHKENLKEKERTAIQELTRPKLASAIASQIFRVIGSSLMLTEFDNHHLNFKKILQNCCNMDKRMFGPKFSLSFLTSWPNSRGGEKGCTLKCRS